MTKEKKNVKKLKFIKLLLFLPIFLIFNNAYATSQPEPTLWEWLLRLWPITFPLVGIIGFVAMWKIIKKLR